MYIVPPLCAYNMYSPRTTLVLSASLASLHSHLDRPQFPEDFLRRLRDGGPQAASSGRALPPVDPAWIGDTAEATGFLMLFIGREFGGAQTGFEQTGV